MPTSTDPTYQQMKEFLGAYISRFLNMNGLPPEKHPIAKLAKLEEKSIKNATAGLRQAINDCVEMSLDLKWSDVSEFDLDMIRKNIVTLSEIRRIFLNKYKKILNNGVIKNDTEYYLLKNILNDNTKKPDDERKTLQEIIYNYEKIRR